MNNNEAVDSSLSSLGFPGFMANDERQLNGAVNLQFTNQINVGVVPSSNSSSNKNIDSFSLSSSGSSSSLLSNDCTFFDSDQLMKFANNNNNTNGSFGTSVSNNQNAFCCTADLDLEPKMKKFSDDFNQFFDLNEKCSFEETFLSSFTKSNKSSSAPSPTSELLSDSSSPQHDTSSSDSGCRSTSSLAEEDSGIASIQSSKCSSLLLTGVAAGGLNALTSENLKTLNVLENQKLIKLEDGGGGGGGVVCKLIQHDQLSDQDDDDCVSNSDTSDDASEIPTDSECLNDLDLLDEIETLSVDQCQDCTTTATTGVATLAIGEPKSKYNQLIEKDGTLVRKKLDFGVYRSINHTFSLFIEPQDILKKLDSDEYEEYVLFPNGIDMIDSYFIIKNNRLVA